MSTSSKLVIVFYFVSGILFAQNYNIEFNRNLELIDPLNVYSYCKKISSVEFNGRLTGGEGYTKAANWAASKFEEWNLTPINENGYLQSYSAPYSQIHTAEMTLFLPGGNTLKLETAKDFLPLGFCDNGEYDTEIVFVGWGISAPELNYDDYANVDVRGKVVMCFRGVPDKNDTLFTEYDQHRHRMKTAFEKGALGLLYIYPIVQANPNGDHIEGFMPSEISEEVADKILAEKNYTSISLKKKLIGEKKTNSFALSTRVKLSVDANFYPDAVGYNIAGYVEGSDQNLKNECVIIGGHFDHCGEIAGHVFNGADDNASGSSVVMAIAEAYSKLEVKPKRSVMFVLFGGEEKGLRGSTYFAKNIPEQFNRVDAMFNFDMVGEGDAVNYGCSMQDPLIKEVILKANENIGTLRRFSEIKNVGVRSSDFAPFYLKGASVAAFFSNGPHVYYHETGDTIYRINPDILGDAAKIGFLSSLYWADR